MTIRGAGPSMTVIDGMLTSRIFTIHTGTVAIDGVTIRNGAANGGGGIVNVGTLTLTNCAVSGNQTTLGSGTEVGGGIINGGTLTLTNCTVSGNATRGWGGGIFNQGPLTLIRTTVSDNSSGRDGGGIAATGYAMTVTDSSVIRNTSGGDGGGIWVIAGLTGTPSTVTLTSSTISGNGAFGNGGGIAVLNLGSVSARSSTITNNQADANLDGTGQGGGVYSRADFAFQNTMLAGNYETFFLFNFWVSIAGECDGPIVSNGYNLIGRQ
jgi:predicted outer membrane repeat protein